MRYAAGMFQMWTLVLAVFLFAAPQAKPLFNFQEVMIPMRDGAHLQTVILAPVDQAKPLPILLKRTPYGVPDRAWDTPPSAYRELMKDGYILVFQNLRGRFKSEGVFKLSSQVNLNDPADMNEGTDTYDTIDWLVKNVPRNNGRVGLLGISYGGWLTVMGMLEPHPALKAVSEQASPADMFLGDDFHHNGAFRLSYGFEYSTMMETDKTNFSFAFDRFDTYEWYLSLGPLSNADAKYTHGAIPTWTNFVTHPNYDAF